MKKILIFSTVLALLPWGQIAAQSDVKPELGVHAGLGSSSLSYDLKNGSRDSKIGGNVGITGTYFLSKNFGLHTGLEFAHYAAKANFNELTTTYLTSFADASTLADEVEYRAKMSGYSEKQTMMTINIPLMAQLQTEISKMGQIYFMGGLKVAIPVSGKFTTSNTNYETSAYFVEHNVEIEWAGDKGGLGTFDGETVKGNLNKKIGLMVATELGFKWNLESSKYLYTGLFLDYGLNTMVKTKDNKSLVEYNGLEDKPHFGANSILSSSYRTNDNKNDITKKVVPFSVGVKVRLAFACGK